MAPTKIKRHPFSEIEDQIILKSPSNLFASESIKKATGIKRSPQTVSVRRRLLTKGGKVSVKVIRFGKDTVKKMMDAQLIMHRMEQDPIQNQQLEKLFNIKPVDTNSLSDSQILNEIQKKLFKLNEDKKQAEIFIKNTLIAIKKAEMAIEVFTGSGMEESPKVLTSIIDSPVIDSGYPKKGRGFNGTWAKKIVYILTIKNSLLRLSEIVDELKVFETKYTKVAIASSVSGIISTLVKEGKLNKLDSPKKGMGWRYGLPEWFTDKNTTVLATAELQTV
jgi:hypothetical protein